MSAPTNVASLPELEQYLADKGFKLTGPRRALLRVLWEADCGLTAEELFRRVSRTRPGTNFSTVYRNLEALNGLGVICLVKSGQQAGAFELNLTGRHHHHIICRACGRTRRIDFCPFEQWPGVEGFVSTGHAFEVYGYCEECLARNR
ncbi:MAG: Fur family transcriptional regulator, partial [Clostridia bacterium]|nr:Fur family transcriptional regulator [Clostridia bacterium]